MASAPAHDAAGVDGAIAAAGWERARSSREQRMYWHNRRTRESLWEDAELPRGWAWRWRTDSDGGGGGGDDKKKEYINLCTGAVQAELPKADAAAVRAGGEAAVHAGRAAAPAVAVAGPASGAAGDAASARASARAGDAGDAGGAAGGAGGGAENTEKTAASGLLQGDDEAASKAYIPDAASHGKNVPRDIAGKRDYLFGHLIPADRRWQLQVDDIALYSVTEGRQAERMTAEIIGELARLDADGGAGRGGAYVITDGTACVGGNTISFARAPAVAHVNAVELSPTRAAMLANNVGVAGLTTKVRVICGDFCALAGVTERPPATPASPPQPLPTTTTTTTQHQPQDGTAGGEVLDHDCVFLDPPWGGPDYKVVPELDMFLGPLDVADVVIALLQHALRDRGRLRLVAIKAPTNYNVAGLRRKLAASTVADTDVTELPMHKMLLLLVRRRPRPGPDRSLKRAADALADDADNATNANDDDTDEARAGAAARRIRR